MKDENQVPPAQKTNTRTFKKAPFKFLESPWFWVFFFLISFGVPLGRSLSQPQPKLPPVLGTIENFELTDANSKALQFDSFKGSVVVVNFIFTSCNHVCPMLSEQMAKIQSRLVGIGPAIQLLSISVDPERDTPEKLRAYSERFKANPRVWHFATGPLETIEKVVMSGFKMAIQTKAEAGEDPSLFEITHGENFVIVDPMGQIRAYKHAGTMEDINDIIRTVAILANSSPKALMAR